MSCLLGTVSITLGRTTTDKCNVYRIILLRLLGAYKSDATVVYSQFHHMVIIVVSRLRGII